jgi:hypothetical protein
LQPLFYLDNFTGVNQNRFSFLAVLSLFAVCSPSAKAGLTIDATFASNITTDSNASTIEASINAAISRIAGDIANNTTVNITFQEGGGLGGSSTLHYTNVPYATYLSELQSSATSADDAIALASLAANPPPNGTTVIEQTSVARILGYANYSGSDGTITLNTSIMNLSRTGTQNPSFYDIQATAAHEIDEVLGIGGPGSTINTGSSNLGPLDLFRYSSSGVRSYTTSTSATPYFSINNGVTDLVHFNQYGGASDYSDWGNGASPAQGAGNTPPQVQDAFGTPGVDANVGSNELTALDVIGWNLTPGGLALETQSVPEPSTAYLFLGGLLALEIYRRRRKSA